MNKLSVMVRMVVIMWDSLNIKVLTHGLTVKRDLGMTCKDSFPTMKRQFKSEKG